MLISFLFFIAITSDRNAIIRSITGLNLSPLFLFFTISFLTLFCFFKFKKGIKISIDLYLIFPFLSFYFLFKILLYGFELITLKCLILSFLIYIIIICKTKLIKKLIYFFPIIGLTLSVSLILQQIILQALFSGYIDDFDVIIEASLLERALPVKSPFYLSLIEDDRPKISFGGLNLIRSSLFTHEPKFAASVLLLTIGITSIMKYRLRIKLLFISIQICGLFLIFSLAGLLCFFVTCMLTSINFGKIRNCVLYITIIIGFPLFILPSIIPFLFSFTTGYFSDRLQSLVHISRGTFNHYNMFGVTHSELDRNVINTNLLSSIVLPYGIIGLLLYSFLFYIILFDPLYKNYDILTRLGRTLLFNTFIVFNIYSFYDTINLFSFTIIVTLLYLKISTTLKYNSFCKHF